MKKQKIFWIKFPYWLGIVADGFWAIALLVPSLFGLVTGDLNFNPDPQLLTVIRIAGVLMAGWTILLIWAVQKPIERRGVILLTALVIVGLFMIVIKEVFAGDTTNIWILVKLIILFILMVYSYFLSQKKTQKSEVP
jgi:FtsH-binding integral membrane protein